MFGPATPVDWAHKKVENRERRAKVNLIYEGAKIEEATAREWLEALVADGTAAASAAAAVKILAGMVGRNFEKADDARQAKILLTESNGFVTVDTKGVFQRSDDDGLSDNLLYVDTRVTEVIGLRSALTSLGVHEAGPAGRLAAVLEHGFAEYHDQDWDDFWKLCRRLTARDAATAIKTHVPDWRNTLRVKTMGNRYRRAMDCLLPGRVVPADGSCDEGAAAPTGQECRERYIVGQVDPVHGHR